MKTIQVIKVGNVINVSLNGKLHQKVCKDSVDANEFFRLVLKLKENPTEDAIMTIRKYLNEKLRIAMMAGLECDPDTGEIYLAGFSTPIPAVLVDVIKEYHENQYPLDAIINFWKLLMINPDVRVRTSLFNFIHTHDFVLTDKGYMIVYKAVYRKDDDKNNEFAEFVSNRYLHVKKEWKCNPNKYVVYKDTVGNHNITKLTTAETWDSSKGVEVLGKLGEMYDALFTNVSVVDNVPVYTDMKTRSMSIRIGEPVVMDRKECDSDPAIDCSYGLHVGATQYVNRFANSNSVILACYVNPANVVAVPDYDHSKMRVSEYYPFAVATYVDKKIDIVEQKYFESDYLDYELDELNAQITKIQANELPIQTAINAEVEERPLSELMLILKTRVVDMSE